MKIILDGNEFPRFNENEIKNILRVAKIDKDLTLRLVEMTITKDGNNFPRFNGYEIAKIVKSAEKDKELTIKLLDMTVTENGEIVPRFHSYEIINIVATAQFDKEFVLQILGLKKLKDGKNILNLNNIEILIIIDAIFMNKNIIKLLKDLPYEKINTIVKNNKLKDFLNSLGYNSLGAFDLYKNIELETIQKIPKNVLLNLYEKNHLYITDDHVSKALEFFKTSKFNELETTIKNKFPQINNYKLDVNLKTYLISKSCGNPDEFIKYIQNLDFDAVTNIAPRIKDFNAEQLLEFLNYHHQKGTELTPENLTYTGSLTHDMEKELVSSDRLRDILSRFPNTNRNVGHLPREWMKDIPKPKQKEFYSKLDKIITKFVEIDNTNEEVQSFEQDLSLLFNKKVTVEYIGSGDFGKGYKILVEGIPPFFLKAFKNEDEDFINSYKSVHGKTIEPQNALYAKGRTNNFAGFYMGKVADTIDKDGYMILEYLTYNSNKSSQKSLHLNKISSSDIGPNHNIIAGKIIDYGEMTLEYKNLLDDPAIARYTRIISDNLILSNPNKKEKGKNTTDTNINTYSFNKKRSEIVKKMAMESNEPEKVIQAIEILENQKDFVIAPNSLKNLKGICIDKIKNNQ